MPAIAFRHLMCGFLNRAVPLHTVTPSFLLSTMDPPIAGQFFNTFNDLFAAVQSHARQTGWAVVKTRASNRRADGNYYKYDLAYDRGIDTHEIRSTDRHEASSRKEGCP